MKTYLPFIIFSLLSIKLQAQIDVAWGGQQIAAPKYSSVESILGGNDTRVFALKLKNKGPGSRTHFYIDTYAKKNLALISTAEFNLPGQQEQSTLMERIFLGAGKYRTAQIEKIIYMHGKFLVFTTFYSREHKTYCAYVQTISESGTLNADLHTVDTISADSKRNPGLFNFILSEDKAHVLIFHNEPLDMYPFEKFSCKMLDENLSIRWSKNFELPYKDKQFHISQYSIDTTGNLFLLVNIDKNKENQERKKPAYRYSIFAYYYKRDQLKEYTIDLGEKFISDITCAVNPAGDLVCAGFYSKSSETAQAGTFFLKIDKASTEVSERNVRDFDKDFLMEFMTERKVEKGKELYNFDIHHFLLRENGSAVMVAEQYFMDIVSYYNPASRSYNYSYHYYYNDIIVVGFDPRGQVSLQKKITKYQHTVNDGGPFSSFVLVDGGDMLHFIYNDNPDNLHRSETEIAHGNLDNMGNPARSVVVMVSMDMKGNTQRTQLLDNHAKRNKSWFRPKIYKKISDKDFILFSGKGKYYRLGRITL
jgi:hypothetical protein